MSDTPKEGLLRLKQIIGDKKAGIAPLFPVSKTYLWQAVKDGRFPAPIRFGNKLTMWRASDVHAFIQNVQ